MPTTKDSYSVFDPIQQLESLDLKLAATLERFSAAFRVFLWLEAKEIKLSPIQIQILVFLQHHKDDLCKVSYLADEFGMTKATISETINTLLEKKYIRKQPDKNDGRSFFILLTAKGTEMAKRMAPYANALLTPLAAMPVKQKEQLYDGLLRVLQHLHQEHILYSNRMCLSCLHYSHKKNNGGAHCNFYDKLMGPADLRLDCADHSSMHS